ncbi:MAG: class I SAM-dependent methyltransferase [Chitinophagaceae bacterium]|nr:class I SAM-dependent methyltransferase [Chitinophagaceae bacterium]
MPASFDHIAPYYDTVASLVFGTKLTTAKKQFLNHLPSNGNILLIGEGTGTILNYLLKIYPALTIDYMEASAKMLKLAQNKVHGQFQERVHFIHGTHLQIMTEKKYDAVIVFFVMDCMPQQDALEFATKITQSLKNDGCFLFADFFPPENWYHRLLLWLMYRFFRFTAGIDAVQLPEYDFIFKELKLKELGRKNFMDGFMQSRVYKKTS